MKYNAKLKAAIQERGLKNKWIAEQLEIDATLLTKWITGERQPNDEQKNALAGLLGCKTFDIF